MSKPAATSAAAHHNTPSSVQHFVDQLTAKLRAHHITGSYHTSVTTAELYRTVVSKQRCNNGDELLQLIEETGRRLQQAAGRTEFSIGNITKRVLQIVRDEFTAVSAAADTTATNANNEQSAEATIDEHTQAIQKLLQPPSTTTSTSHPSFTAITTAQLTKLKPNIIEEIGLLLDEIKTSVDHIAEQAIEHIHSRETILVYNYSHDVLSFLREAATLRKFECLVVETATTYSGHKLAVELAACGIDTTMVSDASVFALVPTINKVIIGTHTVLQNGALLTAVGALNIALAAKHYNKPLVVLAGLHKLTPITIDDDVQQYQQFGSSHDVLPYNDEVFCDVYDEDEHGSDSESAGASLHDSKQQPNGSYSKGEVTVLNPLYDYVPAELVTLFITNVGAYNPSAISRLLTEYY